MGSHVPTHDTHIPEKNPDQNAMIYHLTVRPDIVRFIASDKKPSFGVANNP